jgi:type I restriction enzyme S subunit
MSERVDRVHGVYRVRRVESSEFKETEIGLIPKDWEVVRLGEVLIESKETNKDNKKLNVFSISNIYGFIRSDEFFDKQVYSKNLQKYKIVKKGDFAYNPARVNVGSLGLFNHNEEGLVSPMYVVFRIFRSNLLLPEFLFTVLKSDRYIQEIKRISMSRGSVRQILSFKDLCDIKIPLPPLSEQKAIAYVLSTIQEAIEKTEQVIKATKELKKSLMKHLFTYGVCGVESCEFVELKETEIGLIPKDWEVVRLGEVMINDYENEKFIKMNMCDLLPFIPMSIIPEDSLYITQWEMRTKEQIRSGIVVRNNDLLIAKITPSFENGKQGIVKTLPYNWAYATTEVIPIRVNNKLSSEFIAYYLRLPKVRHNLACKMEGTTGRKRLPKSQLENLPIPLPPLHIQQQIAEILKSVDDKIQAEENKKKALEDLFKSMLHNLMTGKIRVDRVES